MKVTLTMSVNPSEATDHLIVPSAKGASIPQMIPTGSAVSPGAPVELLAVNSDRSAADFNVFFRGLREMIENCGDKANKNEVVANVIVGCLLEGIDEGYRITGIVKRLGFNRQHAGMTLRHLTDGPRTSLLWAQKENGRYYLLL